MRTKEVEILGKKYLMNFSNAVLVYMEQNNIKLEQLSESEMPVTAMLNIIHRMIQSGAAYSKKTGGPDYPTISLEDLSESTDVNELSGLMSDAVFCITGQRNIEAIPKKKEGAPSAEAQTN